jgi:hypothetical protein
MDSKAEEVVKDIEAIRESFNLPQEVENWVREYAVRGMGRGGIERTGNFDFYAEFLSQKRIPDRDEIKSALARWRRATVPGLLYRLFPVSVTPMTAIEGDHD